MLQLWARLTAQGASTSEIRRHVAIGWAVCQYGTPSSFAKLATQPHRSFSIEATGTVPAPEECNDWNWEISDAAAGVRAARRRGVKALPIVFDGMPTVESTLLNEAIDRGVQSGPLTLENQQAWDSLFKSMSVPPHLMQFLPFAAPEPMNLTLPQA